MKPTHTIRDIFLVGRLALHPRQIWLNALGLITAGAVFYLFTLLAMLLSGGAMKFPLFANIFGGPAALHIDGLARGVYGAGAILAAALLLVNNLASCRLAVQRLKEQRDYTVRQSHRFALRKSASLFGSGMLIFLIIAFFVLVIALVLLIGKIPLVGEIVLSVAIILLVLWMAIILLLALIALLNLLFGPAFIALDETDALGAVYHTMQFFKSKPAGTLAHLFVNVLFAGFAAAMFAAALLLSFFLTNMAASLIAGEAYTMLAARGMAVAAHLFPGAGSFLPYTLYGGLSDTGFTPGSGLASVMSWLWAGSAALLCLTPLAYGLAAFNSGMALSATALYHQIEGEDLLARRPAEGGQEAQDQSSPRQDSP